MGDTSNRVITNATTQTAEPVTGVSVSGVVAQHFNLRNASGTEIGTATTPLVASLANEQTTTYAEVAANLATAAVHITLTAVASQKHRVYALQILAAGATTITVKDGSTTLIRYFLGANGGIVLDAPADGRPWFTGTANTNMTFESSAAVETSYRIYYETAA